ncbi:hypothetical protein ACP4OV_019340 [Aristida adscensionis]
MGSWELRSPLLIPQPRRPAPVGAAAAAAAATLVILVLVVLAASRPLFLLDPTTSPPDMVELTLVAVAQDKGAIRVTFQGESNDGRREYVSIAGNLTRRCCYRSGPECLLVVARYELILASH